MFQRKTNTAVLTVLSVVCNVLISNLVVSGADKQSKDTVVQKKVTLPYGPDSALALSKKAIVGGGDGLTIYIDPEKGTLGQISSDYKALPLFSSVKKDEISLYEHLFKNETKEPRGTIDTPLVLTRTARSVIVNNGHIYVLSSMKHPFHKQKHVRIVQALKPRTGVVWTWYQRLSEKSRIKCSIFDIISDKHLALEDLSPVESHNTSFTAYNLNPLSRFVFQDRTLEEATQSTSLKPSAINKTDPLANDEKTSTTSPPKLTEEEDLKYLRNSERELLKLLKEAKEKKAKRQKEKSIKDGEEEKEALSVLNIKWSSRQLGLLKSLPGTNWIIADSKQRRAILIDAKGKILASSDTIKPSDEYQFIGASKDYIVAFNHTTKKGNLMDTAFSMIGTFAYNNNGSDNLTAIVLSKSQFAIINKKKMEISYFKMLDNEKPKK